LKQTGRRERWNCREADESNGGETGWSLSLKTIEKAEFKLYSQKAGCGGVETVWASSVRTKSGKRASKSRLFLDLEL
jgi:hypothetical protein